MDNHTRMFLYCWWEEGVNSDVFLMCSSFDRIYPSFGVPCPATAEYVRPLLNPQLQNSVKGRPP